MRYIVLDGNRRIARRTRSEQNSYGHQGTETIHLYVSDAILIVCLAQLVMVLGLVVCDIPDPDTSTLDVAIGTNPAEVNRILTDYYSLTTDLRAIIRAYRERQQIMKQRLRVWKCLMT